MDINWISNTWWNYEWEYELHLLPRKPIFCYDFNCMCSQYGPFIHMHFNYWRSDFINFRGGLLDVNISLILPSRAIFAIYENGAHLFHSKMSIGISVFNNVLQILWKHLLAWVAYQFNDYLCIFRHLMHHYGILSLMVHLYFPFYCWNPHNHLLVTSSVYPCMLVVVSYYWD